MKTYTQIFSNLRSLRRQFEGNERIKQLCYELESTISNLIDGVPNLLTHFQHQKMVLDAAVDAYTKCCNVGEVTGKVRPSRASLTLKTIFPEKNVFYNTLQRHGYQSELYRLGLLDDDNFLNMTGKELISYYRYLVRKGVVEQSNNITYIFKLFSGAFKLTIKNPRSMQAIPDTDDDYNAWDILFLLHRKRKGPGKKRIDYTK